MTNRLNTIAQLDTAITTIEQVKEQLIDMVCVYTLDRRVANLLRELEDLRVDIMQADLPGEQEILFIPR